MHWDWLTANHLVILMVIPMVKHLEQQMGKNWVQLKVKHSVQRMEKQMVQQKVQRWVERMGHWMGCQRVKLTVPDW